MASSRPKEKTGRKLALHSDVRERDDLAGPSNEDRRKHSNIAHQETLPSTPCQSNSSLEHHSAVNEDLLEFPNENTQKGANRQLDANRQIDIEQNQTRTRSTWSKSEYEEVMYCHYMSIQTTGAANMKATYNMWRQRNPVSRPNLTSVTLANQRRFIETKQKLSKLELDRIKAKVMKELQQETEKQDDEQHTEQHDIEQPLEKYIEYETTTLQDTEEVIEDPMNEDTETLTKIENKLKELEGKDITKREKLRKVPNNAITNKIVSKINNALKAYIQKREFSPNITEMNQLIYSAALVVIELTNVQKKNPAKQQKPAWKTRIEQKIQIMRKDLGQLTEIRKTEELSKRLQNIRNYQYDKHKINDDQQLNETIEILKQKIQAKAQRIKRYTKRGKGYIQNKIFKENPKKFYQQLETAEKKILTPPETNVMINYWKDIWEKDSIHEDKAQWIDRQRKRNNNTKDMEWEPVTKEEVKASLDRAQNWKSPGPDGIQNFWLKKFTATHESLAENYNNLITEKQDIPEWLTLGKTYLIPKNDKTEEAKNYRPITCLATTYKNLTAVMSNRMYKHLDENDTFPTEQKGCRRNTYGCKEHLLTNQAVVENSKQSKKNLSMAWVDYRKAFDSVPHTWLIQVLELYKINAICINFIKRAMKKWNINLVQTLNGNEKHLGKVNIKQGIFQGDTLSPLMFCLAMFPLSGELNNTTYGYKMSKNAAPINHLLYVDDLKLFAKNDEELERELSIVKIFSDDIQMKFGLEKCAKVTIKRGKIIQTQNIVIEDIEIKCLEKDTAYKYLGLEEINGMQHEDMKKKVTTEYYRRTKRVLTSELNAKNKIIAITGYALPVLTYSYEILKWRTNELQKIDRKTRKFLTMHGMHHPSADVDRLYVPRWKGGRGLTSIEDSYQVSIFGMGTYITAKENDKYIEQLRDHENKKTENESITKRAKKLQEKYLEEREMTFVRHQETQQVRKQKQNINEKIKRERKIKWTNKNLHGQWIREIEKTEVIDKHYTFMWQRKGEIKGETEALLISAQDQALATRYYKRNICALEIDPKCRYCKTKDETIHHILSGCSILAQKEYIQRHDQVCSILHYFICKHYRFEVSDKYYEHKPPTVNEREDVVILWNMQIHTDRHIPANKPDIVIKDKVQNKCLIIDVAIPADQNIAQKESEKLLKYKDLQIEVERMWHMKSTIVPIIIGVTGVIHKNFTKHLEQIPGIQADKINMLQKQVILGTAHIIRRSI